jgi:hypothetical protein
MYWKQSFPRWALVGDFRTTLAIHQKCPDGNYVRLPDIYIPDTGRRSYDRNQTFNMSFLYELLLNSHVLSDTPANRIVNLEYKTTIRVLPIRGYQDKCSCDYFQKEGKL